VKGRLPHTSEDMFRGVRKALEVAMPSHPIYAYIYHVEPIMRMWPNTGRKDKNGCRCPVLSQQKADGSTKLTTCVWHMSKLHVSDLRPLTSDHVHMLLIFDL